MKMKKMIALILCAALIFSVTVGCGDGEPAADPPDDDLAETSDGNDDDLTGIDFAAAIATFPPDTVMIKASGFEITWAEFYFFLFGMVNNFLQSSPDDMDWSEVLDGTDTLADIVLEYATEEAISFIIVDYGAGKNGMSLSADDLDMINTDIEGMMEEHGGKDGLEKFLRENGGFYNLDVFERFIKVDFIGRLLVTELYGEDFEDFADEKVAAFAESNDFIMAKHILRLKDDDNEEANAETLQMMEDILDMLRSAEAEEEDNIELIFDELMYEFSEDEDSFMFAEGYLFQFDDMPPSFSEACFALEIGEISDVIEAEWGYHIFLRLPIDYDSVPLAYSEAEMYQTLRQIAAFDDFDSLIQSWQDALDVEFTPEYLSIDLASIFVPRQQ